MAEGTFGDNIAGFLQGLTGEILKRKDEERALKQRDEDIQLQTGLNLFNEMMSNPDKYDDTSIRLFADMLGKNHRLEKVIGQPIQSAISPLLANRAKMYEQFQQNKGLTSLLGPDLQAYSPYEVKKYIPMAAQADINNRQWIAEQQRKTDEDIARNDANTSRLLAEHTMGQIARQQEDAARLKEREMMIQGQKDVAGIRSTTDIQEANIRRSYMEDKIRENNYKSAEMAARFRLRDYKKSLPYGKFLSPEQESKIYQNYKDEAYASLTGQPYEIPKDEEDPLAGRAEGLLSTLAGPTTMITSTPTTTTTTLPKKKGSGYIGWMPQ